jgi:hypothetical protein
MIRDGIEKQINQGKGNTPQKNNKNNEGQYGYENQIK